jgi:hypothetical protein
VKTIWHRLLRGNKAALEKVDEATVKVVELRVPKYSRGDARFLQGQILGGQIFGAFSAIEREEIWHELRATDHLIPTLYTLFEDLKYLTACADCLKRLVPLRRRDTVSTALRRKFPVAIDANDQGVVEVSDSTFVDRPGSPTDRLDLGYRQFVAMRDAPL